jgi:putative endonuclease
MPRRSGVAAKAGRSRTPPHLHALVGSKNTIAPAPTVRRICHSARLAEESSAHLPWLAPRHRDCWRRGMPGDKRFVYVLRNVSQNPSFYVGLSSNVGARLADHHMGRCRHTASRRPWQLHVVIEFSDEDRAIRFERYLKSGSGRAFAKRHFEP